MTKPIEDCKGQMYFTYIDQPPTRSKLKRRRAHRDVPNEGPNLQRFQEVQALRIKNDPRTKVIIDHGIYPTVDPLNHSNDYYYLRVLTCEDRHTLLLQIESLEKLGYHVVVSTKPLRGLYYVATCFANGKALDDLETNSLNQRFLPEQLKQMALDRPRTLEA